MRARSRKEQVERFIHKHGDRVERAVDNAARAVDRRLRGRHRSRIERASDSVKRYVRTAGQRRPRVGAR